MGWRETCAVDERMRFVMAAEKREEPFAALCRQFGVSRKVGYKWLGRYREAMGSPVRQENVGPPEYPPGPAAEICPRSGRRCARSRARRLGGL